MVEQGRHGAPGAAVAAPRRVGARGASRARLVRTAAFVGLLGVIVIVVACLVTAAAYSGRAGEPYSPFNHWISELGEIGVSRLAGLFNVGLIVGGSTFVVFHVGLLAATSGRLRSVIAVVGVISGVAGAFVGVFPMNSPDAHAMAALTFFLTGWIGPALLAARIRRAPKDGLPRWLAAPGFAGAVAFVAFLIVLLSPASGASGLHAPAIRESVWIVAALEWATLIAILAWTACAATVLLRRESTPCETRGAD